MINLTVLLTATKPQMDSLYRNLACGGFMSFINRTIAMSEAFPPKEVSSSKGSPWVVPECHPHTI